MEEKFSDKKIIFVTCGDWDLKTMLPNQCQLLNLSIPSYLKNWVNIKIAFASFRGTKDRPRGMTDMLSLFNLPLIGRHHSGIDDSRNIAAVLMQLIKKGAKISPTFLKKGVFFFFFFFSFSLLFNHYYFYYSI